MHIGTEIWRNDHWEGEQNPFLTVTVLQSGFTPRLAPLKNSNGDVVGYVLG